MQPFGSFLGAIALANRLSRSPESGEWLFYPGMLFDSPFKWWGDYQYRVTLHEGIDIRYFRTDKGDLHPLEAGSLIPCPEDGRILNICKDYLGYSMVIEHDHGPSTRLTSVLAHIVPEPGITYNDHVLKDQIVARVSDAGTSPLEPHLHFSIMEVPHTTPYDQMNWDLFSSRKNIALINPVFMQLEHT